MTSSTAGIFEVGQRVTYQLPPDGDGESEPIGGTVVEKAPNRPYLVWLDTGSMMHARPSDLTPTTPLDDGDRIVYRHDGEDLTGVIRRIDAEGRIDAELDNGIVVRAAKQQFRREHHRPLRKPDPTVTDTKNEETFPVELSQMQLHTLIEALVEAESAVDNKDFTRLFRLREYLEGIQKAHAFETARLDALKLRQEMIG